MFFVRANQPGPRFYSAPQHNFREYCFSEFDHQFGFVQFGGILQNFLGALLCSLCFFPLHVLPPS
jgi:hypothetical protein